MAYEYKDGASDCDDSADTILSKDECDVASSDTQQTGVTFEKADANGELKNPPFCTTESGVLCRDDATLQIEIDYGKFNLSFFRLRFYFIVYKVICTKILHVFLIWRLQTNQKFE